MDIPTQAKSQNDQNKVGNMAGTRMDGGALLVNACGVCSFVLLLHLGQDHSFNEQAPMKTQLFSNSACGVTVLSYQ